MARSLALDKGRVKHHLKPAEDHAPGIEQHVHGLHLRVLHHLLVGGVAHLLGRPLDSREDHRFTRLGVDGMLEIGDLAIQ